MADCENNHEISQVYEAVGRELTVDFESNGFITGNLVKQEFKNLKRDYKLYL